MTKLTHLNESGEAKMVDVSQKKETSRIAIASGCISLNKDAIDGIKYNLNKKGDVLGVARIAGIQGAKQCSNIIPLCHPLMITKISVDIEIIETEGFVSVSSSVGVDGKTGVEMEAMTATSVALLTIYDMCKAVDKNMVISNIKVMEKHGGKNGSYIRSE